MGRTPVVSVIIPAWNAGWSLARTLDSVKRQTFADFEALVIDDGSTDDTAEVAAQAVADDPRFRLIRQANSGAAGARNRGLAEARGRYLANLDADDVWRPEFLARTVEALEAAGPDAAFAFARSAWIDADDRLLPGANGWTDGPVDYRELLLRNPVGNGSAALLPTAAVAALGGWDGDLVRRFGPAEDWQLLLQLAARGPIAAVNETLVLYRMTASGASSNVERATQAALEVIRRRRETAPRLPRADYWAARSLTLLWLARRARGAGRRRLTLWLAAQAYLLNPLWFRLPELRAPLASRLRALVRPMSHPSEAWTV